jgi:hypothetical protein
MKNVIFILLVFLKLSAGAQTKRATQVFTVEIMTEQVDSFLLGAYYIPLERNIKSDSSEFFVSKNPTKDELLKATVKVPSENFAVSTLTYATYQLSINREGKGLVVTAENIYNHRKTNYPLNIKGDISENRALEIIQNKLGGEPELSKKKDKLKFYGKSFSVYSHNDLKKEVIKVIVANRLNRV